MNSKRDLYYRLLKGFPVASLKSHFNEKINLQRDLINKVLDSNSYSIINDFVFQNFNFLKQHIYFFESNNTINIAPWKPFPSSYIGNYTINNKPTSNSLLEVNYKVFDIKVGAEVDFNFLVPIQIRKIKSYTIISINTLERDLSSYFSYKVFVNSKTGKKDKDILQQIKDSLSGGTSIIPLDLNKGIKHLWEIDKVDAKQVQFKNSNSKRTEVMDEDGLYKKVYPSEYQNIKNKPLDRNVFKILDNIDGKIDIFTADASKGIITISNYPKSASSVFNIVDEIINNN